MHGMQASRAKIPSNRIAECREWKGLRLAQVAAALDVDQSTVWRWENKGGIPDRRKEDLADLLGVSVPYLMGWSDQAPDHRSAA